MKNMVCARSVRNAVKYLTRFVVGSAVIGPLPFWSNAVLAQSQPAPAVEWRAIMHPPQRPGWGTQYNLVPGSQYSYTTSTITAPVQDLTPEQTGEDWWYDHCNLYDEFGTHIGYATAGYNTFPNRGLVDAFGCFDRGVNNNPDPDELETPQHRKGASSTWVARYDLAGNQLWCRTHLPGIYYGVMQDHNLDIVLVGKAIGNRRTNGLMASSVPAHYNPGQATAPLPDLGLVDCITEGLGVLKSKIVVAKVDLDGTLIWNHLYAWPSELADGWGVGAEGHGICSMLVNGSMGYYVVGSSGDVAGETGYRASIMRLDADGNIHDRHRFLSTDGPMLGMGLQASDDFLPFSAVQLRHGGNDHVAIGGLYYGASFSHVRAFMWYAPNAVSAPYSISMTQHTAGLELIGQHPTIAHQASTDIALFVENGTVGIAWPVVSNYSQGLPSAGVNVAQLLVHKFSALSPTPLWTKDLGEIRAFDLHAGITATSDGALAVVSTKWQGDHDTGNPIEYGDLPQ